MGTSATIRPEDVRRIRPGLTAPGRRNPKPLPGQRNLPFPEDNDGDQTNPPNQPTKAERPTR